jgi:hypothetical protein
MHECEKNDACTLDPSCPHVDRCWLTEERHRNEGNVDEEVTE